MVGVGREGVHALSICWGLAWWSSECVPEVIRELLMKQGWVGEMLHNRCQVGLPKDLLCFSLALSVQKALGIEADCLFSPCVPRWWWSETERSHPEEHRNWPGCGNAQQDRPPSQPRVHRGQHEQLWIRGKVSHQKGAGWSLVGCSVPVPINFPPAWWTMCFSDWPMMQVYCPSN